MSSAIDMVLENASEGHDTICASFSYALPANVEQLVLTGANDFTATGNGLSSALYDNSWNNVLNGGVGNDYLMDGGRCRQIRIHRQLWTGHGG